MAEFESKQNKIREAPNHYGFRDKASGEGESEEAMDSQFIERMRICADLAGSVNALARKADLSQSGIRRYFTGGDPTRRVLIALAEAAGVNVLWLATGEGKTLKGEAGATGPQWPSLELVPEILRLTIETVEEALLESDREMPLSKKAELVMAVYELYRVGGSGIEKSAVLRLVKSAS